MRLIKFSCISFLVVILRGMHFCLQVFCLTKELLSRKEIAEFLLAEGHFDSPDAFSPSPNLSTSLNDEWESLKIEYESYKGSLVLARDMGSALLRREIQQLLIMVNACVGSERQRDVQRRLKQAGQAFAIYIDTDAFPAKGWSMLDSLESYLARKLDGIIYAPGEGFFDSDLRHIHLIPENSVIVPIRYSQ